MLLIFGNDDDKNACTFYHDEEENIWVGSATYNEKTLLLRIYEEDRLNAHNRCDDAERVAATRCVCKYYLKNERARAFASWEIQGAGKSGEY